MKVEDITHLHEQMVEVSTALGADYPEDVVQDVWIKLLEIEEKEGSLDRLTNTNKYGKKYIGKNLLYIMIRNDIIDKKRKNATREKNIDIIEIVKNERVEEIKEAMELIGKRDKELYEKYIYDGLTIRDLAKMHHQSKSKMHRRIQEITRKIRKIVGQNN